MIRKIAMLGLAACFLALGACDDLCGSCDSEAATDGAAVQSVGAQSVVGGDACAECLDGCDEGGLAADAGASPAVCPMSGSAGEGVCGVVDKENCGMAGDCAAEAKSDCQKQCETQCETQCEEKPASPKVSD